METLVVLCPIESGMRAPVQVHALTPQGEIGPSLGGRILLDWLKERFSLPEPDYPAIPRFNRVTGEMPAVDGVTRVELPASWRGEYMADLWAARKTADEAFDAAFATSGIRAANEAFEEARDRALKDSAWKRRNQDDVALTKSTLWRVKARPYVRA